MKPSLKIFLKIFLLIGLPYGLIVLGLDFKNGGESRIWKTLFTTFAFGITMALVLVLFHWYRLKKNGVQKITDKNVKVHQVKNLNSKLNKTQITEKLKTDPIIGKMKMTEIEDGILLKTGTTWKSWGEEIKIVLKSDNDGNFEYQISSRPKLKTTLVDYGKNLENVNQIEKVLENIT